jgi:hypothetical protein
LIIGLEGFVRNLRRRGFSESLSQLAQDGCRRHRSLMSATRSGPRCRKISQCLGSSISAAGSIPARSVRAGLIKRGEDWPWSSGRDCAGSLRTAVSANRILAVDRVLLPADERARI